MFVEICVHKILVPLGTKYSSKYFQRYILCIKNYFLSDISDYFCKMIVIENTIISEEVISVRFACNLKKCLGTCCVEGNAGAPLESNEISIIEDNIDEIKNYMQNDGILVIERIGVFDYDEDGNYVTPLINNKECAFTFFENGIAKCAIEKAYNDKKIDFKKPISCHLYPIRISKIKDFDAINYHKWEICDCALKKGEKQNIQLYKFLKEPLIRNYGIDWYNKLQKEIDSGKYELK